MVNATPTDPHSHELYLNRGEFILSGAFSLDFRLLVSIHATRSNFSRPRHNGIAKKGKKN